MTREQLGIYLECLRDPALRTRDAIEAAFNERLALASAASGGDVQQAPAESPQSGPAKQGNAQKEGL